MSFIKIHEIKREQTAFSHSYLKGDPVLINGDHIRKVYRYTHDDGEHKSATIIVFIDGSEAFIWERLDELEEALMGDQFNVEPLPGGAFKVSPKNGGKSV